MARDNALFGPPHSPGTHHQSPIPGVVLFDLVTHVDDRGELTELFRENWDRRRSDETGIPPEDLGRCRQVYASGTLPGVVKAWHYHKEQTDRFTVVQGRVLVVCIDGRAGSEAQGFPVEFVLDAKMSRRQLTIPPGVWHGWMTLGNEPSVVLNCTSREHNHADPDEVRAPANGGSLCDYDWHRRRDR
jgi:dTDP-4-dehydrorhamnose 3,5-epimerase